MEFVHSYNSIYIYLDYFQFEFIKKNLKNTKKGKVQGEGMGSSGVPFWNLVPLHQSFLFLYDYV